MLHQYYTLHQKINVKNTFKICLKLTQKTPNFKMHKTPQTYLLKIPPLYSKRFPAIIKT